MHRWPWDGLVATAARVDQEQVGEARQADAPKDAVELCRIGQPVGEPLATRLECSGAAILPWPVTLRLVLIGAAAPRPVGELVIVERKEHRVSRMDGLGVRVRVVLGVAPPVVVEVTHSWSGSNGRPMSAPGVWLAGGVCDAS